MDSPDYFKRQTNLYFFALLRIGYENDRIKCDSTGNFKGYESA